MDQLRVSVRLARVDQNAIEARNRLGIIQATLAVLMGREPTSSWDLSDDLVTPVDPPVTATTSLGLRADEAATETTLQRRLELANAEAGVRAATARIEASRLAVEQAQESLRIEQRKYDLGQGTITDVLDAQSATVESESLRARALADHVISLAARDFAAGHVFTAAAAMPALRVDPVNHPVNDSASQP